MKNNLSGTLLFMFIMLLPVFLQASEYYHSAHSILFEVIEDGAISSKRVSLDFDANNVNGTLWAECRVAIITINKDKKHIDLPPKKWTRRRVGGIIAADLKTGEVSNGRSREQEAAV